MSKASIPTRLQSLLANIEGVSTIEIAVMLPIFMSVAMYGIEVANMASANMQVSQLATSVADNASRLGQTDNSAVTPTVSEAGIDSVMIGAIRQGRVLRNFEANGRIILSSLERHPDEDVQWIHWQRCAGNLDHASAYGNDSTENGINGSEITGLGRFGRITAPVGDAVMFVEVYYNYTGIFGDMFVSPTVMRQEAAFIVRDDRDLMQDGDGVSGTGGSSQC